MVSVSVSWPSKVRTGGSVVVKFYFKTDREVTVEYGALIAGRGRAREGTLAPGEWVKDIVLDAPDYPGTYKIEAYAKVNGVKVLDKEGSITVYSPTPPPQPSVTIKSAPSSVKPGDYVTIAIATSNISGSYYVDAWLKDASGKSVLYARKSLSGPVSWTEISLGTVPKDISPGTGKIEVKLIQSGRTVASTSRSVSISGMKPVVFEDLLVSSTTVKAEEPVELTAVFSNPNDFPVDVGILVYVNGVQKYSTKGTIGPGKGYITVQLKFYEPGTYRVEVEANQLT